MSIVFTISRTLEIDKDAADVHNSLSDALARKGLYAEALAEKRHSLVLYGDDEAADILGRCPETEAGYRDGLRTLARKQLELMEEASTTGYISPMNFAVLYAVLDQKDHAFEWLERAFAEHSPWLTFLRFDPQFEDLRSDPRFADLVRRVGFGS